MRNLINAFFAVCLVLTACENDDNNNNSFVSETVAMGMNSTDDVYYSLANGTAATVERTDWDIAFSVPLMGATILINEGAGVELYCVGDTNDWASVDDNSITTEEQRFNDKSNWAKGAFNHYASGIFNFGWGTYHSTTDHNVGGDSIYVMKLTNGTYKKFMVRVKLGSSSSNVIRWADLNGSNEVVETFSTTPYFDKKHFIHYSLVNKAVVEAEPDQTKWDLLFTRYVIRIPTGPATFMNYPVMGVLSNQGVTVSKVTGVDVEKAAESDVTGGYSDAADAIGHDWKVSDPVTHAISLVDSCSYFIKSVDGKKYQLYFSDYGGNTAGTINLKLKTVE